MPLIRLQLSKKRRGLQKLQNKDILDWVEIEIKKREDIFIVKSFLIHKIPKVDFNKRTKIYLKTKQHKILLDDLYILDDKELSDLKLKLS